MSEKISRRLFLKGTSAAGALGLLHASGISQPAYGLSEDQEVGTIIDLTKCDGCIHLDTPACVTTCRQKNEARFPDPIEDIQDYWPQTTYEDWSKQKDTTNRLTPYNWNFVEHVKVEDQGKVEDVYFMRRCMHCDHPTCEKLCPFAAISKDETGSVSINEEICLGGAKCRDVCPWGIPQRQAGVGIYLDLAPTFAGGGVMFKCDNCRDLLAIGEKPLCETVCPNNAIITGPKEKMKETARSMAKAMGGSVYGDVQNGGTSTFYVSKVPFEAIHQAIAADKKTKQDTKPGRPLMPLEIENKVEAKNGMALGTLGAPVAGAVVAGYAVYKSRKGADQDE